MTLAQLVNKAVDDKIQKMRSDASKFNSVDITNAIWVGLGSGGSGSGASSYQAAFLIADWVGSSAPYSITYAAATTGFSSKYLSVLVFDAGTPNDYTTPDYTVSDAGEVIIYTNTAFDGYVVITDLSGVGSTSVSATLAAASWVGSAAPYTQAVTVAGMTSTKNGNVGVAQSATAAQRTAARAAQMSVTSQGTDTITVTADGTLPTVDIPITVILIS